MADTTEPTATADTAAPVETTETVPVTAPETATEAITETASAPVPAEDAAESTSKKLRVDESGTAIDTSASTTATTTTTVEAEAEAEKPKEQEQDKPKEDAPMVDSENATASAAVSAAVTETPGSKRKSRRQQSEAEPVALTPTRASTRVFLRRASSGSVGAATSSPAPASPAHQFRALPADKDQKEAVLPKSALPSVTDHEELWKEIVEAHQTRERSLNVPVITAIRQLAAYKPEFLEEKREKAVDILLEFVDSPVHQVSHHAVTAVDEIVTLLQRKLDYNTLIDSLVSAASHKTKKQEFISPALKNIALHCPQYLFGFAERFCDGSVRQSALAFQGLLLLVETFKTEVKAHKHINELMESIGYISAKKEGEVLHNTTKLFPVILDIFGGAEAFEAAIDTFAIKEEAKAGLRYLVKPESRPAKTSAPEAPAKDETEAKKEAVESEKPTEEKPAADEAAPAAPAKEEEAKKEEPAPSAE